MMTVEQSWTERVVPAKRRLMYLSPEAGPMSSALEDDTLRTIQSGRETAFTVLGRTKKHLQKAFIVFVIGLVGSIFLLRVYVWEFLQANTRSRMSQVIGEQVDIIARNPFDVILVQVKIGLFVGILLAVPLMLYYSRDAIRERGFTSAVPISRTQQVALGVLSAALFLGGLFYAYAVFFPVMFDFLATNAVKAAVKPSYDIVMYVQFLLLLTVSFGLAAQLPLFMSVLAYAEVVPYESFRDRWKHAVVVIFTFGAMFSPPDPFTQIMWALPLCALYLFSLGLAKLVTNIRRSEDEANSLTVRSAIYRMIALFVLVVVAAGLAATRGGLTYFNTRVRPQIPDAVRPDPVIPESVVGVGGLAGDVLFALVTGLLVVAVVVFVLVVRVLNDPVVPRGGFDRASGQDPSEIDLLELTAAGVRSAPPEVFAAMDEDEAVDLARRAMEDDDHEKAQAILDRFDEVETQTESRTAAEEEHDGPPVADEPDVPETGGKTYDQWPPDTDADASGEAVEPDAGTGAGDEGGLISGTFTGMADAVTDEDTSEEEIGGYLYDLTFIIDSITSKAFRIVGVFMVTLGVVFYWLYQGGLGVIKSSFFSQVDPALLRQAAGAIDPRAVEATRDATGVGVGAAAGPAVVPVPVGGNPDPTAANYIIALHPVEQLVFEVKVSAIVGAVVALPVLLYYAWPAIKERGVAVGGDRRVFLVWGGTLIGGMLVGSLVGFFYIAPSIISWLVADALRAEMVISYRLNAFMWLVIFTTVGIGLLADVPLTMVLFDRAGIVGYGTMRRRWREVVLAIFAITGLVLPGGTITMFILALPTCLAYATGLGVLWAMTLPRRFGGGGAGPDEEDPAVV